jgi:PAS domain S-box-containing protein
MISGISGFDLDFPAEYLKAALILSLLTVWVLVGLFFYLNLYTKRRYFTVWTAAWLFYALWLTLCISLGADERNPVLMMFKQWCVSASAVCLLWGSGIFLNLKPRQSIFGLFIVFLFAWSYLGAYHLEKPLHAQLPIFGLIALASLITANAFLRLRLRRPYLGAGLLAVGFALWGVYLGTYPFLQESGHLISSGFVLSAVLQLFIAVSMIILVLEEARTTNELVFRRLHSTKNQKAELRRQVQSTEERYRTLFDEAHEAIVIAAADDLRLLEVNQAARRLLGFNGERPAQPFTEFVARHDDSAKAPKRDAAAWFDWLAEQRPLRLVRCDGAVVEAELNGAKTDYDGRPAYQFFVRELTERARLEQQLRQAEKLSAMGQMISGVAHELNNPLAVIQGYLELILAKHPISDQTRADLQKVTHEAQRAAKLVGNFLTFAREKPAQRERVDLNAVIQRAVELQQAEFKVTGIEVKLELDAQLPAVEADPDKVQQLLVILVNNALHALLDVAPPGRLRLVSERAGERIRLKVIDNGPGVPPALAAKIFEPFFTTKPIGVGTGLGLSIAHSIMAEHQGRITHEPAPGGGACFILEFPLPQTVPEAKPDPAVRPASEADRAPAVPAATAPKPEAQPVRPARVLVVDDEKAIAELLAELLSILGYTPTVTHSAPEALEQLATRSFDVILSDFRMPGMDGREFYQEATRRNPGLAQRIIFLTGDVVNEETRAFVEAIGAPFIGKPFHLEKVEQAIAKVLQDTATAEAAQER